MQALLELDCIPAGMELFPAANDDQWTLIKEVIDDCDYYIVILAGRYGSIGPEGIGYTEMEYRYALEKGKPIIGFLHKDPGNLPANRCEGTTEDKEKLVALRAFVQKKLCRFWDSPADLGSQVSRSLVRLIKDHPSPGWVKGDLVPQQNIAEEMLKLKNENEMLRSKLEQVRIKAPEGTESLAQGDASFTLHFEYPDFAEPGNCYDSVVTKWNDVFSSISPIMIDEASDNKFLSSLNGYIVRCIRSEKNRREYTYIESNSLMVLNEDFQTVKVQLRALGLITQSSRNRSIKDTETYWTLTPYGDTVMTRLRAIKKDC